MHVAIVSNPNYIFWNMYFSTHNRSHFEMDGFHHMKILQFHNSNARRQWRKFVNRSSIPSCVYMYCCDTVLTFEAF